MSEDLASGQVNTGTVKATATAGVARRPHLVHQQQHRVAIAVHLDLTHALGVARRFPLDPAPVARSREIRRLPGGRSVGQSAGIHPGQHQDPTGGGVLGYGGHQTRVIEAHLGRNVFQHASIVPTGHDGQMSASSYAALERAELSATMLALGPDAPTLCAGWTVKDLAIHLIVREGKPLAAVGIVLSPFAALTASASAKLAQRPFSELVSMVADGPPTLSVFSVPGMEGLANFLEYVVHHEDVRRAQPQWTARDLDRAEQDLLWSRTASTARLIARKCPVALRLRRTDATAPVIALKSTSDAVTLAGSPLELILRLYGRTAVNVEVSGSEQAVRAFEQAPLGI